MRTSTCWHEYTRSDAILAADLREALLAELRVVVLDDHVRNAVFHPRSHVVRPRLSSTTGEPGRSRNASSQSCTAGWSSAPATARSQQRSFKVPASRGPMLRSSVKSAIAWS